MFIPRTRDDLRLDQRISYLSYSFRFYPFFPFNCISSLFFPWIRGLHTYQGCTLVSRNNNWDIDSITTSHAIFHYLHFPAHFRSKICISRLSTIICIIIVIVGKNANMRAVKGTIIDLFQHNVRITSYEVLREGCENLRRWLKYNRTLNFGNWESWENWENLKNRTKLGFVDKISIPWIYI